MSAAATAVPVQKPQKDMRSLFARGNKSIAPATPANSTGLLADDEEKKTGHDSGKKSTPASVMSVAALTSTKPQIYPIAPLFAAF